MEKSESVAPSTRPIPLALILMAATVVHLPLMLMKLPLKTYDANFHIFFASHYLHNWFNPWNPKWYAGFSQATYPPLPQQWVAVASHLFGLDMAYMAVQFCSILLLTLGVYRFSRLWVSERAASFAALGAVFLGSESFLVYAAGQLGTTSAAPIYLNALPYLFDWLRHGSWKSLLKSLILFGAAAAAHHATLIFGTMFFALPVLALAFIDRQKGDEATSVPGVVARAGVVIALVGAVIVAVLLPFWIALLHYPVTQKAIPHASRANYILSPEWGINYFVVPYGALILALPFILIRGSRVMRLRPLLFGLWLALLVGMGSTTPVGRIVLGRGFEVITMERFSYWATLLALPFIGQFAVELIDRYRLKAAVALLCLAAATCALGAAWSTYKPPDAKDFEVDSVATWLNRDGHDKYRYVTLGFGNKIARLAVLTDASSVDGEWNSGRMLPELTANGAGQLTSSKFFGKAGIDALTAILEHADRYGLKWVLVRDPYYDPLLTFAGWRRVDDLNDKTIVVWSKDGVPPAEPVNAPQIPPRWQGLMWGILPFGSSLLAILIAFIPDRRRIGLREDGIDTRQELAAGEAL